MRIEEFTIDGPYCRLAIKRTINGERPLLALHGWLDNAGSFDPLSLFLDGYDLVAFDFSGQGLSQHRPGNGPYHFVDWVAEALAVVDHLGWDRFALMGHSMGAGVATLLAGALSQRIDSLVLIEGIGPYTNLEEEAPQILARALHYRPSNSVRVYQQREEALKRLMSREIALESAECLARRALRQTDEGWFFDPATGVRAPSKARLSEAQVRAFLRAVTAPTLLILGEDGLKPPALMEGREKEIASLTLRRLPGGHHLHMEDPAALASVILPHLLGEGDA